MKKLAFLVLAVVIGYLVLQKSSEKKREMLVGTWKMERQISGGASRMHINLKPEGDFYIVVDAASGGQTAFGESTGKWKVFSGSLKMNFTHNGIPGVDLSKHYGGPILTLDDKTLSYRSLDGVETWKRVR